MGPEGVNTLWKSCTRSMLNNPKESTLNWESVLPIVFEEAASVFLRNLAMVRWAKKALR